MTDPLDELAEAWEHKTPGPWAQGMTGNKLLPEVDYSAAFGFVVLDARMGDDGQHGVADAHFIALAGTHVGTLLDRLRAAEAVCEAAAPVIKIGYDDGPEEIALSAALDAWRQLRGPL